MNFKCCKLPSLALLFLAVCCITVCNAQKAAPAVIQGGTLPEEASTKNASTSGNDAHAWRLKREERSAPLTD